MQWAACLYGAALAIPIFTHATLVLAAAAPVIAFGGGLTMTLPYAILMPLMPRAHHGMLTGFYSLSRGLGVMLGPLLAGLAIQLLSGQFTSTRGYGAMWIVTSAAVLASIPVLVRLRRCGADKPQHRPTSGNRGHGKHARPTAVARVIDRFPHAQR
jgi:MFS family permease